MMKKHNIFNPLFFLAFLIIAIFAYYFFVPMSARDYFSSETVIGRWLKPTKDSLKKVTNLIRLPYWLRKSKLPVYYIQISGDNEQKMIDSLPFDSTSFSYGLLTDDDKQYVNADFTSPADGYSARIKIRYRGGGQNNWDSEKKSLRIKFPKDNFYLGMRGLHLLLPSDGTYFGENLNVYRAKKLGLLVREKKPVRVVVNGRDGGVYWAIEPWSKEFLARNGLIDTNNIFANKDKLWDKKNPEKDGFLFKTSRLADWQSYTAQNDGPFDELHALLAVVENADDKEFAEKIGSLLDLEKFYRWQLLYALAGSNHISDFHNFVLLFRQEDGKFELIPFDLNVGSGHLYDSIPTLPRRILAIDKFLKEYQEVVNDYTSNEDNLKDDLAYYDGLYQKYFYEFYKDQTKAHPDYIFDRKVKQYRSYFVDDFKSAGELTAALSPSDFASKPVVYGDGEVNLGGSFKHFNDIFLGIDQFLVRNPQFIKRDRNTLVLSSGAHVFTNNVIVPKNLSLVIEPGAKMLMAPKVSLISYSPVTALGNASLPITITALNPSAGPWGSFGVVDTAGKARNYFSYLRVSGGSAWEGSVDSRLNGIPFISQFSLRNADSEIYNSIFENGYSDDAFHAIGGSVVLKYNVFRKTSSDALDLDGVKDSIITGNTFYNSNVADSGDDGDGLDVSGTENLEISDNKIYNFGDKCISIGEKAEAFIKNNILLNCNYGIAVKDDSKALMDGNLIIGNRSGGLTLYRKKQEFVRGGNAEVINSVFWNNQKEILVDETTYYPTKSGQWQDVERVGISQVSVKNSTIMGGYDGENIDAEKPNFAKILPAFIYNIFKDKLNE